MNRLKSILIAAIFLGFGGYRLAHRWWLVSHWQEVPATHDRVWVEETRSGSGTNYAVKVLYSYVFGEKTYQSNVFDLQDRGPIHGDPAKSESIAAELRTRTSPTCWIDPDDPQQAVLDLNHDYEFDVAFLVIGLVSAAFASGGPVLGVLFKLGRRWRRPGASPSIEEWWRTWLTNGFALLVLGGAVIGLTIFEWQQKHAARTWTEVPCLIEESRLTYSSYEWKPIILYSYVWEGETHRTNQVSFETFSGSVTTAEKHTANYPAGSAAVCYVNPANPAEAVLIPAHQPSWALVAASVAMLILLGGSGLKAQGEWRRIKRSEQVSLAPESELDDEIDEAETTTTGRAPVRMPRPTRRQRMEARLARGRENSVQLRRQFLRLMPWSLGGGLFAAWLARDAAREWSLGVWPTYSQWLILAATCLICALPLWLLLMAYQWWKNRRLQARLRTQGPIPLAS